MGNELQPKDFLTEATRLGDVFVQSGMFKDIKTQAEAVVKILAGKELGLSALESMTNIYIVNGKVALQSKVIGALIKKSGKYDFIVGQLTDEQCAIDFFQIGKDGERTKVGTSTFTKADAAKAGIVNKDVWKSYPRNMLYSRALSNGGRWFAPDAFCGYTVEEVEDINKEPETKTVSLLTTGEVVQETTPKVEATDGTETPIQ